MTERVVMKIRNTYMGIGRVAIPWLFLLMLSSGAAFGDCPIDEEYAEAMQQTEDEFNAFQQTMEQGSAKLKNMKEEYQKWEDAVFSQNPEKGIQLAKKLFNLTDDQTDEAKKKVWALRDMFNQLDANGLKTKLESAVETMEKANGIAKEVQGVWQFARKFNPANAKDKPTYGLRMIGDILKEGSDKMKSVPLVGQILGHWVGAYAEVTGDFANALDRLSKKIQDFRQGALCGQSGVWMEAQQAFFKAQREAPQYGGEDCLTYFSVQQFPRIHGMVFAGNANYFLYDPPTCRGYFSPKGMTEQVYDWFEMLIRPRRMTADWLANRSRSIKPETIERARRYAALFVGWANRTDKGWELIEKLGRLADAEELAEIGEEPFVANYLLDDDFHQSVEAIIKVYDEHVFAAGTVREEEGGEEKAASGAQVTFVLDGQTATATTDAGGQYEVVMTGKVGGSVEVTVSKPGFDEIKRTGSWPEKVVLGYNFTLGKEAETFTISGLVYDTSGGQTQPVAGASVSASSSEEGQLGSVVTGADGAYSLIVTVPQGVVVNVSATKDGASAANSTVSSGGAKAGLDIMLNMAAADEGGAAEWTITVTVVDANGLPLPNAVVSGGPTEVTTDASGIAVVGPIPTGNIPEGEQLSVTLSATVTATGDVKVSGTAATVIFEGVATSAVTLSIPVEIPVDVTITGLVTDANGVGIEGAAVTVTDGPSSATGGAGGYTLGPIPMTANQTVTINAAKTEGSDTYSGSPVTVAFDGRTKTLSAPTIVLSVGQFQQVTITGRVIDADGKPIEGATVSVGGVSTASGGGGQFTLPSFEHELGKPVTVDAVVTVHGGTTVSGSAAVTPKSQNASVTIAVQVEQVPEDELDDLISDLEEDIDDAGDRAAKVAQFKAAVAELDGLAASFRRQADFYDQRVRELAVQAAVNPQVICGSQDISYALAQAQQGMDMYSTALAALPNTYADVVAAFASDPFAAEMELVDAEFSRVYDQKDAIESRYASMLGSYALYECDKDNADTDAGQIAQDGADPDDIEGGAAGGGGVEVCDDGIDNDGDGEIDECDAGCCDKNVQVTVSDCGTAADDIFEVAIDGAVVGLTPKGAANTFNTELRPGGHSVTITCLDDGGVPPGSDIGTACVTIVIYGNQVIGGSGLSIAYGGSSTVGFDVPVGDTAPPFNKIIDGSLLGE